MPPLALGNGQSKNILIIDSQKGSPYHEVRQILLKELKTKGLTEENGFFYEYYSLSHYEGTAKNLWEHRITKKKYDVIFLNGTIATRSFKEIAWKKLPHIFIYATVTDPLGLGVISQYGHPPPGNFTGVTSHLPIHVRLDFIKQLLPNIKNIGLIYADMPQSQSYRENLEKLMSRKEWKGIQIHFRKVEFIPSDGGHIRMAKIAEQHVEALNPIVDVFISPSDQMGAQKPFAQMVLNTATKPLIGIGPSDVLNKWGATASIYLDLENIAKHAAIMIEQAAKDQSVKNIYPIYPQKYRIAINRPLAEKFGLSLPEEIFNSAIIVE